jgi:hypothetical protein
VSVRRGWEWFALRWGRDGRRVGSGGFAHKTRGRGEGGMGAGGDSFAQITGAEV